MTRSRERATIIFQFRWKPEKKGNKVLFAHVRFFFFFFHNTLSTVESWEHCANRRKHTMGEILCPIATFWILYASLFGLCDKNRFSLFFTVGNQRNKNWGKWKERDTFSNNSTNFGRNFYAIKYFVLSVSSAQSLHSCLSVYLSRTYVCVWVKVDVTVHSIGYRRKMSQGGIRINKRVEKRDGRINSHTHTQGEIHASFTEAHPYRSELSHARSTYYSPQ